MRVLQKQTNRDQKEPEQLMLTRDRGGAVPEKKKENHRPYTAAEAID